MQPVVNKLRGKLLEGIKFRAGNLLRRLVLLLTDTCAKIRIANKKIAKLIFPPQLPSSAKGVFLNLGCGKTVHPQFINIDAHPYPFVHYIHRIDKLPMFDDNSVNLIYASHCLEHFKYRDVDRVIKEWTRVLKPGGILRLSVPDFDKLLDIYKVTENPDDIVEQLMGGQDNKYNFHYAVLNWKNLTSRLRNQGYVDIREWKPGEDNLSEFDDFSVYKKEVNGNQYSISLNIQARKSIQ